MWLDKVFSGVLRILTPLGPRYLKLSLVQRLYLLWVFRNFPTLPVKVLTSRQRRFVESLCAGNRFVSFGFGVADAPLLGTLEQRPSVMDPKSSASPDASVARSVGPFATETRR